MKATLERLNYWITEVPTRIQSLSELELSIRPQPNKWSKKEILGHLCDSTLTNLQRFVRAQYESKPYLVLKYAQNEWVDLMDYLNLPVDHILSLWLILNKQVVRVISTMTEDRLLSSCEIGEGNIVTLEWLIKDYVEHMEHHLEQIFLTFKN